MNKRFSLLVLFCLCTLAVWAYESDQFQVGQLRLEITSSNTVEVTHGGVKFEKSMPEDEYYGQWDDENVWWYEGEYIVCGIRNNYPNLTSVNIPPYVSYNGRTYRVSSIADYAFYGCSRLSSVTIPNTVEYVGKLSFFGCRSLRSITLPNSVKQIGYEAFSKCESLISINLPTVIEWVGYGIFDGTAYYNSLPNGAIYINDIFYAYKGELPPKSQINIREGTYKINGYAFYDSHTLVSVSIPTSVMLIEDGAFIGCPSLTRLYYKGTLAEWEMIEKEDGMDGWEPEQTYTVYCTDGVVYGNDF